MRWRKKEDEGLVSALYDRQREAEDGLVLPAEAQRELADFGAISALLHVPDELFMPDPGFLVRFRRRRDEVLAANSPWRWLAWRLVPVATGALAAAILVLSSASPQSAYALSAFEELHLGDGVADVSVQTTEEEPVLRIALGEL